jgi:hypothetical protein
VTPTSITVYETQISQYPELMRDGRLFHLQFDAEIANRARTGPQTSEDPDSAGGGKCTHDTGDLLSGPQRQLLIDRGMVGITHTNMFTCACVHVNRFIQLFLRQRIK